MPMLTRQNKSCVVTFRVTEDVVKNLAEKLAKRPIVGIRSTNQYARKLLLDFVHGDLLYLNGAISRSDPSLQLCQSRKPQKRKAH